MTWWWSYLLTVLGVLGLYFVGRGWWWGWAWNVGLQFFWLAYSLASQQYGFIFAVLGYGAVNVYNLWKVIHVRHPQPDTFGRGLPDLQRDSLAHFYDNHEDR